MRRSIPLALAAAVSLALTALFAYAAVNWKSGPTGTFNADHTSFTITGEATGLGNQPAIAHVTVNGTVTYTCQNKGGNQSPGQNPVPASSTFDQNLGNSNHNGRGLLSVTAAISADPTVSGKVAGCPNGNWSGVDPHPYPVTITSAVVTITQGGQTIFGPVTYSP
jgi:hypothetical protein